MWGSQLLGTFPGRRVDGVIGVWYGKAPGVDRSADALRHGNHVGSDSRGGAIALCGGDPECESSTLPSASEATLAALEMPILFPADVAEALDFGRHAIACARASGLWTALKVNTVVADATATLTVGLDRVGPVVPTLEWEGRPYVHRPSGRLLSPDSLELERTLRHVRTDLARLYAQRNGLNEILPTERPSEVSLGIVTAGPAHHQVLAALRAPRGSAARDPQAGMLHPFDDEVVRQFARGLDEILVVEEKGPFVEPRVIRALYRSSHRTAGQWRA